MLFRVQLVLREFLERLENQDKWWEGSSFTLLFNFSITQNPWVCVNWTESKRFFYFFSGWVRSSRTWWTTRKTWTWRESKKHKSWEETDLPVMSQLLVIVYNITFIWIVFPLGRTWSCRCRRRTRISRISGKSITKKNLALSPIFWFGSN